MNPIPKNQHFLGDHSVTDWLHLRDRLYQVSQKTNHKAHLLLGIATPCFAAIDTVFNLITASVSCMVDGGKAAWKGEWQQHRKKGSWPLIKAYFAFLGDHYSFAGRCAWATLNGCVLRGFWDAKGYAQSLPSIREAFGAELLQRLKPTTAELVSDVTYYQKILDHLPPDSELLVPLYSHLIKLNTAAKKNGSPGLDWTALLTHKNSQGRCALDNPELLKLARDCSKQNENLVSVLVPYLLPDVAQLKKPEIFLQKLPLLQSLPHQVRLKLLYDSQALVMEKKDWTSETEAGLEAQYCSPNFLAMIPFLTTLVRNHSQEALEILYLAYPHHLPPDLWKEGRLLQGLKNIPPLDIRLPQDPPVGLDEPPRFTFNKNVEIATKFFTIAIPVLNEFSPAVLYRLFFAKKENLDGSYSYVAPTLPRLILDRADLWEQAKPLLRKLTPEQLTSLAFDPVDRQETGVIVPEIWKPQLLEKLLPLLQGPIPVADLYEKLKGMCVINRDGAKIPNNLWQQISRNPDYLSLYLSLFSHIPNLVIPDLQDHFDRCSSSRAFQIIVDLLTPQGLNVMQHIATPQHLQLFEKMLTQRMPGSKKTALHTATNFEQLIPIFNKLTDAMLIKILSRKDDDGNTPIHHPVKWKFIEPLLTQRNINSSTWLNQANVAPGGSANLQLARSWLSKPKYSQELGVTIPEDKFNQRAKELTTSVMKLWNSLKFGALEGEVPLLYLKHNNVDFSPEQVAAGLQKMLNNIRLRTPIFGGLGGSPEAVHRWYCPILIYFETIAKHLKTQQPHEIAGYLTGTITPTLTGVCGANYPSDLRVLAKAIDNTVSETLDEKLNYGAAAALAEVIYKLPNVQDRHYFVTYLFAAGLSPQSDGLPPISVEEAQNRILQGCNWNQFLKTFQEHVSQEEALLWLKAQSFSSFPKAARYQQKLTEIQEKERELFATIKKLLPSEKSEQTLEFLKAFRHRLLPLKHIKIQDYSPQGLLDAFFQDITTTYSIHLSLEEQRQGNFRDAVGNKLRRSELPLLEGETAMQQRIRLHNIAQTLALVYGALVCFNQDVDSLNLTSEELEKVIKARFAYEEGLNAIVSALDTEEKFATKPLGINFVLKDHGLPSRAVEATKFMKLLKDKESGAPLFSWVLRVLGVLQ